eukprot:gnl/Trimastix_PCT/2286.p1 GENE.gnl/Trimastix_PCT/2286~~gnl/Trimastix_PCT/2286.p1  ORF type:complete len:180 (+),score=39.96 gnl/Trimastix_PCT/2286:38-541(+)
MALERLQSLFPELVAADGSPVSVEEALNGKWVGIFFCATWSKPCRDFVETLITFRQALLEAGKPFEVVLVGYERTPADLLRAMQEQQMPWPALAPNTPHEAAIKRQFPLDGVPALAVLDPERAEVLHRDVCGSGRFDLAMCEVWEKALRDKRLAEAKEAKRSRRRAR